eukprot:Skav217266  [mRNA]  locus=scaffold47:1416457:1419855:+ [translate_table: standard]
MDPTVDQLTPGERFSLVAVVNTIDGGVACCTGIAPVQHFVIVNVGKVGLGKHTFYDLIKAEEPGHCVVGQDTMIFHHADYPPFQNISVMDFCCGMGGFSLGSQRLGIPTLVFVDKSEFACQAVRANFQGHVIHGDLSSTDTLKQAHAHRTQGHLQITGGFACQGFSTQGDQRGMDDHRSHSLLHILRGAWLLQADDILLECVANVVHFPAAQRCIDEFAAATNMQTCRLTFDLKDQLRQGGVRGFGITSAAHGTPRHLHPCEGSTLCTVLQDYVYPGQLRGALCLLGQIAAPLQVLWIQAQILAKFQQHHWGMTYINPMEQIQVYQHELRLQAFTRWITPSMFQPRTLHMQIEDEKTVLEFQVKTPTTVLDLKQAEKQMCGWGEYPMIKADGFRLHHQMQLFPGILYQIQRCKAKHVLPAPVPTQIRGAGTADQSLMLGDKIIWAFMNTLSEMADTGDYFLLHPFQVDHFLQIDLPDAVTSSWRDKGYLKRIVTICEHHGHWILLHGAWNADHSILWTFFDGLRADMSRSAMLQTSQKLTHALQCHFVDLIQGQSLPQQSDHVCGTIALLSMGLLMHLEFVQPHMDITAVHDELLQLQLDHTSEISHIFAGGPDSWQTQLRDILRSKGVPASALDERCQLVISKLGASHLQNCMRKKNPWAELKAAASKPGTMFRLVTQSELKDYIDSRAQTKHGAQIRNHKQKKLTKQHDRNLPVTLDPEQFEINANHFKDGDDLPVGQIDFDDVEAEARGVALTTVAMARSFLEQPTSISTDALALLIIDRPPEEVIQAARLTKVVIPAKFKGTDEHTLIYGHIMQLGDNDVVRENASTNSSPDIVSTKVIKLQVFNDQLSIPWNRFAEAPIRTLVAVMEPLQLCRGANCGASCGKFHPAVDETVDNVICELWARSFFDDNGKKVPPSEARLFTAFLRIPDGALDKLLSNTPQGVYVEPRGERPKEHDDRFRVIWLPGATYDEAIHQCKTLDKAISLVRLKNKFGIRVKTADEKAAWSHLRPGTSFTPQPPAHL